MITAHELTLRREHLHARRRLIVGRSVAAAVAGVVPVPVLEDWLSFVIQRGMLRRVAQASSVDISDDAALSLVYGKSDPPSLPRLAGGVLAYRLLLRRFRSLMITYITADRAQAAARIYIRGTLFDHYCARLHVGMGLEREDALVLRKIMDRAMEETPGGLGRHIFRRALVSATKATVRAPLELADIASGGRLRRLLRRNPEGEIAAEEVDMALERHMSASDGFLTRAAAAVEIQLSVEMNPYLDRLIDSFERLWEAHAAEVER